MAKFFGWLGMAAFVLVFSGNACYMLISPRAWFRLPRWIRLNGSMTQTRYSTRLGEIQIRLLGALFLALFGWVIYDSLFRKREETHLFRDPHMLALFIWVMAVPTVLMAIINGLYMLISPQARFHLPRWIRSEGSFDEATYATGWGSILVRVTGAFLLAGAGWAVYLLLSRPIA